MSDFDEDPIPEGYYEDTKELPHNLEAEQALLGACLVNNQVLDRVVDFLEAGHFANGLHQQLFKEFVKQFTNNTKFTPITLKTKFEDNPLIKEAGGTVYLSKLAASAITIINAADYGRLIHDLYIRRSVIEAAQEAARSAYDGREKSGSQIVEETQLALQELHSAETLGEELLHISVGIDEELEDIIDGIKNGIKLSGITTGLKGIDAKTGGMGGGQLIVLAGRPAMGKTALALNISKGAARAGHIGAFFSIEMKTNELRERMVSDLIFNATSPIKYFDIKNRKVEKYEIPRLESGFSKLKELPLYISDRGGYTVESIRREVRRLNRHLKDRKIEFMVIDYLQLMSGSNSRQMNKVYEIGEITRGLKKLANELNIPIILLSQLSRQVEQRDDKRPILSDLRDSGSIEQDADIIMFVYREHYYLKDRQPKKDLEEWEAKLEACENKLDVIIGKQRRGPTGTVKLDCYLHSNAIRDGMNDRFNGV